MAYYPPRSHPETISERTLWLLAGFVLGALAVLVFHQAAFALLHSLGVTPKAPYSLEPTAPFGLPQVWSATLWGGAWGVLLAAAVHRVDGAALVAGATLFGLIFPTLAAWFIVAALKQQPLAAGFAPKAMLVGPIVNAAWGFGAGLGLAVFRRMRHAGPSRRT